MRVTVLHDHPRIHVLAFDKGDEVMSALRAFWEGSDLRAASLSAIGAFSEATLAYFERGSNAYSDIPVREQVEVVSLLGNVAYRERDAVVHLHAVLGRPDGSTIAGHLVEARVWPTLEMYAVEGSRRLGKRVDPETGLALLDLRDE